MTEILLKNNIDTARINALLAFLDAWGIEAEIKDSSEKPKAKHDIFAETRGMWADYDIDIKKIRKQSREKRTKTNQ